MILEKVLKLIHWGTEIVLVDLNSCKLFKGDVKSVIEHANTSDLGKCFVKDISIGSIESYCFLIIKVKTKSNLI